MRRQIIVRNHLTLRLCGFHPTGPDMPASVSMSWWMWRQCIRAAYGVSLPIGWRELIARIRRENPKRPPRWFVDDVGGGP